MPAQPSKFQKVYGKEKEREAWSYFVFTPKQDQFDKMTRFGSADRFYHSTEERFPYKKQLAVSKKSDFDEKEPKGVKFGKDRDSNCEVSMLNQSVSAKEIPFNKDLKPQGCLLGK